MINNIQESVISILSHGWVKLSGAFGISTLSFFFDLAQKDLLISLLALIIIDSITAVYANFKKGNPIESRKIAKTAGKIAVYFLIISAGFISERAIEISVIDTLIITYFTFTELWSILENAKRAGVPIPEKVYKLLKKYDG